MPLATFRSSLGWPLGLLCIVVGCTALIPAPLAHATAPPTVDFNRDVRPILAAKCFKCHGPDEQTREAGLRLDTEAGAMEDLGGYRAVEPGTPEESELLLRVTTEDPDLRMPPPEAADGLSDDEVEQLRQWILAGGTYTGHWAFEPPQPLNSKTRGSEIPASTPPATDDWARDPIDHVVWSQLRSRELSPSPAADRWTLARRLYLDVLGVAPTPKEAEAFVHDDSPMAYAKLVDRLQANPAQAERQARLWLDLARYADTNGYEKDRPRTIWPYRDWVLNALANDMPFDQFTVEQLAGDMLPNSTIDQRIATGFLRNTMLNEEGGIDPLEYRFYAMVDRVNTVGTVWLGMTIGCAQCHTHKYDPITHRDYYALMALLNNADEPEVVVSDAEATAKLHAHQQRLDRAYQEAIAQFTASYRKAHPDAAPEAIPSFEQALAEWSDAQAAAAVEWKTPRPSQLNSTLPKLRLQPDGSIFADGDATKRDEYTLVYDGDAITDDITALRLEVLPDARLPAGGPGRSYYEGRRGDFFLSELRVVVDGQPIPLQDATHSHGSLSIGSGSAEAKNVIDGNTSTGWSTSKRPGQAHRIVLNLATPIRAGSDVRVEMLFERHFAASLGRFRIDFAQSPETVRVAPLPPALQQQVIDGATVDTLLGEANARTQLQRAFLQHAPYLADSRKAIEALLDQRPQPTTSMVLRERAADNMRPTYRHHRGEYLKAEERVSAAIPEMFRDAPTADSEFEAPRNRLELARWLVSRDNPLAARVTANRQWRLLFGHGLVRTAGDFGTQAEPPEYPELLDALAVGFMDEGWSLKRLQRRILLSSLYRQSSSLSPELAESDPDNRWLARGPRFRLDAEVIRDTALRVSGQLTRTFGGPSVRPPQPAAVTALAYGSPAWNPSQGGDRYRRSVYTFAKRTAPFASYTVFDAPTRETCIARRDRSNTPLQSLTLLNDPMYVELSRATADLVVDPATPPRETARALFQRILTRPPSTDELDRVMQFVEQAQTSNNDSANDGNAADAPSSEVWMLLARALMNTDEAITKE